jgi:hypothetical protein
VLAVGVKATDQQTDWSSFLGGNFLQRKPKAILKIEARFVSPNNY